MDRIQMKLDAKRHIKGNILMLLAISLIIGVIYGIASFVLSFIPVAGTLAANIVISPAFTLSLVIIYMNLASGKAPEIKDAFLGFDDFWSAFKVNFFTVLFTYLWALLFVIPGIVKAISYSQAMYILAENKEMPALEAIERSKKMMHGHKMDYFVLCLSFIGWLLLACITCGIAYIYVAPYMSATFVNFYNSLKGQHENTEVPAANQIAEAGSEEKSE